MQAQRNAEFIPRERVRYGERCAVKRTSGRLKDEFSGRDIRVRRYEKVLYYLVFSAVVHQVGQMLRIVQ